MVEQSRTRNTYRNLFWGTASKVLAMICPFIFRAVIIREIGSQYVGLNGLFSSILHVLNMTELGFGSAITFMMYKPVAENNIPEIRRLLNTIRRINKIVGLVILALGSMVYPLMDVLVKNDTGADVNIYVLYTMYLFSTVFSYLAFAYWSSVFVAYQRSDILAKLALVTEVLKYSLQAVVLYVTRNYYLYILTAVLTGMWSNVMHYYLARRVFPSIYPEGEISPDQKKEIMGKVTPLLVHRIGGMVIVSIDSLIISSFLGLSALTYYDNYRVLSASVTSLLSILRSSVIASLGNKLYTSSRESMFITYKKVFFLWVMLVGWCTCFFLGLYQPFIRVWVGEKYLYPDSVMLWICIYFFVWQFRFIGITMKEAAGLWEPDRWKPVIGMTFNFVFSILLVKITGSVLGVLWPTMVVMLFIYYPWETYVLFTRVFDRGCREYVFLTLKCVGSVAIAAVLLYLATFRIPLRGINFFCLRFVLCVIIPFTVFTVIHGRSEQYQSTVNDVKRMIRKLKG